MDTNVEENAWLEGKLGELSGAKLDLQKEETLLGRGSGCHIQIKDPKVSRSHASIQIQITGLTITDLNSASGTFINGKRVSSGVLKNGDIIQLGDSTFEVCFKQDAIPTMLEQEPPSAPPPAPLQQVSPPVIPPPVPPPPPPVMIPSQDAKSSWKPIATGCGVVLALAVCGIGAFLFYTNFIAYDEPLSDTTVAPDLTFDEIAADIDESELSAPSTEAPGDTPEETSDVQTVDEVAGDNGEVELVIRAYDEAADEDLNHLTGAAEWDKESSLPGYAYYSGTWIEGEPGVISSAWCADDKEMLDESYPHVRFELVLDGRDIPVYDLTYSLYEHESIGFVCARYFGVVEGLPAGEHIILDTLHFDAEVTDGQMMYGPGPEIAEFAIQVLPWISVSDSFDEASDDWTETQQTNFNLTQSDSKFIIEIFKEYFTAWSLYDDLILDDANILTSAVRASEGQGAYGIVFRYQDVNNFYYFRLDDDGYFEIGKRVEGEFIPLSGPTYSSAILQNGEYNKLALIVAGDIFHAYINFEDVATVIDSEFDKGQLGMMASTPLETTNFKAEFDYFSIDAEDKTR